MWPFQSLSCQCLNQTVNSTHCRLPSAAYTAYLTWRLADPWCALQSSAPPSALQLSQVIPCYASASLDCSGAELTNYAFASLSRLFRPQKAVGVLLRLEHNLEGFRVRSLSSKHGRPRLPNHPDANRFELAGDAVEPLGSVVEASGQGEYLADAQGNLALHPLTSSAATMRAYMCLQALL